MAGLQHDLLAPRRSTRFTPRVSSVRTICERSKKRPRPLFQRHWPTVRTRPEPSSNERCLFMRSSTFDESPLDAGISDALTDLALDLRWSFNHSADQLWGQLDPELW